MSSPVERYVPFHKRSPSASSMTLSTASPVLSYARDELLALAPSTSTSHSAEATAHSEHTYMHPQPHQGWAALNTAMRNYIRHSCPEIIMNRKMRKSVEYQQFQHRASEHAQAKNSSQRTRSRSPSERSDASSSSSNRRERSRPRDASPASQPRRKPETQAAKPAAPASIKKRTQPRRTRSGANNARARFNSFNAFHKQLAGAGADRDWRRSMTPVPPLPVSAH